MQLIICVSDSHSLGQVPRFKPEDGDDYYGDDDDDDDGGDGDGDGDDVGGNDGDGDGDITDRPAFKKETIRLDLFWDWILKLG